MITKPKRIARKIVAIVTVIGIGLGTAAGRARVASAIGAASAAEIETEIGTVIVTDETRALGNLVRGAADTRGTMSRGTRPRDPSRKLVKMFSLAYSRLLSLKRLLLHLNLLFLACSLVSARSLDLFPT